jgi:hypothetical protein
MPEQYLISFTEKENNSQQKGKEKKSATVCEHKKTVKSPLEIPPRGRGVGGHALLPPCML